MDIKSRVTLREKYDNEFRELCERNDLSKMKQLYIEHYIIIDALHHAIIICCRKGYIDILKWLLDLSEVDTYSIYSNGDDCAEKYIKSHVVHAFDDMAFRFSCEYGHLEIMKLLIIFCNKKCCPINIHVKDEYAFFMSIKNGHLNIVNALVKYGKTTNDPVNIHVHNDVALINSCIAGHNEIVNFLLNNGIYDEEVINNAKLKAIKFNQINILKLLDDYNARNLDYHI